MVQLRDASFKGESGNWSFGHHTAVVLKMNRRTGAMEVLQQNVNGKRSVQHGTLNVKELRHGWLRVYRPVAKRR